MGSEPLGLKRPSNSLSESLQAHDEELKALAARLHDTTAQNLAALAMNLSLMEPLVAGDARLRQMLAECSEITADCVKEVRTLSYLLYPPLLDELGLPQALRSYAQAFQRATGMEVALELPRDFPRLAPEVEYGLFRIVQERLMVLSRKFGRSACRIAMRHGSKAIELSIWNAAPAADGEAISPSREPTPGTIALYERARKIRCKLDISAHGGGTEIRARIPRHEIQNPNRG
jgi:two-component system, NarL family, sensor kinase